MIKPVAACGLLGLLLLGACSGEQKFIGEWKSNNPENVMLIQQGGGSASAVNTIEFKSGPKNSEGDVVFSSVYEISVPDSMGNPVSVTGNCRADGRWELDIDDDDDMLMSYDYSSINIEMTGDSLVAARVRPDVEKIFRDNLTLYSVVEDVEVNRDQTTLSMEVGSPDKKVYFKRVGL